jgi:hypothetical protein
MIEVRRPLQINLFAGESSDVRRDVPLRQGWLRYDRLMCRSYASHLPYPDSFEHLEVEFEVSRIHMSWQAQP